MATGLAHRANAASISPCVQSLKIVKFMRGIPVRGQPVFKLRCRFMIRETLDAEQIRMICEGVALEPIADRGSAEDKKEAKVKGRPVIVPQS